MTLTEHAVLLRPEEVQSLALRYRETRDRAVEDRLVRAHLRLVAWLAQQAGGRSGELDDLFQEGCVGLLEGIRRFDPDRGTRLSTYASWWIRARLFRYVLRNRRLVRLGTTTAQRKVFFNLARVRDRLERERGVEPTVEELAHALGVAEADVVEIGARLARTDASLDESHGDAAPLLSRLAADDDPEEETARGELRALVRRGAAELRRRLGARDRAIFDARFRDEPKSLSALGRRFGVSRERMRQLEARLLERLRPELARLAA